MRFYVFIILMVLSIHLMGQEVKCIFHETNAINSDNYEEILTFGEDLEGNIFAVGSSSKIYKYDNTTWTSFTIPYSNNNKIQEITGDEYGNLYIGVQNKGLLVYKNNKWKLFNSSNSIYPDLPQHGGIAWDKNTQTLWIGTDSGLIKYTNDSLSIYNHGNYQEMVDDDIIDLVLDADGSVWMISHLSTLVHLKNDTIITIPVGSNLELYNLIFTRLDITSNGELIITSLNYGLLSYDLYEFRFYDTDEKNLLFLDVDAFDNIWAGNKNNLYEFLHDSIIPGTEEYVPLFINNIHISSNNHLWIAGENDPITEVFLEDPNLETTISTDENILTIYPVPVSRGELLTLDIRYPGQMRSTGIFDLNGRKVLESNTTNIPTSNFERGVYLLTLSLNQKIYTRKIIVK